MTRNIDYDDYAGPIITLSKLSEFLKSKKVVQFRKEHREIRWPSLRKPEEYLEEIADIHLHGETNRRKIYEKGRTVWRAKDDYGLMPSVLVFKSGEEDNLKRQFIIEDFLYRQIAEVCDLDFVPFSMPVCFRAYEGGFIYVMKGGGNISLDKLLKGESLKTNEEPKKEVEMKINKALKNLALLHGVLIRSFEGGGYRISGNVNGREIVYGIREFDYLMNFLERGIVGSKLRDKKGNIIGTKREIQELIGIALGGPVSPGTKSREYLRLGYNDRLPEFLRRYNEFAEANLSETPFEAILHCDMYPTNVLDTGVIIDPKPLKRGNPMLDVSHFLIAPALSSLGSLEEQFLGEYLDNLQNFSADVDNAKRQALKKSYRAHVLHNSLCLIGAMLAQRKTDDAQYFLGLAIETMGKMNLRDLRESFNQYIKNSKHRELKAAL